MLRIIQLDPWIMHLTLNSYGYATTYGKPGKPPALVKHSKNKTACNFDAKIATVKKN